MIQTEVLVLKRENAGEIDRRYSLLTRDFGRIEAVAKGIRQIKSKLAGHLEPLNLSWVALVQTKAGAIFAKEAWQITQALEKENFANLRKNRMSFQAALKGADILNDFLAGPLPDIRIWELWLAFLYFLEKASCQSAKRLNTDFAFAQLALKLTLLLGFLPLPDTCASCGKNLSNAATYFKGNQFLCDQCKDIRDPGYWLSRKTRGVLGVILKEEVWLKKSSEERAIEELAGLVIYETRAFLR